MQAGEVSLSRTSDASDALIVQAMCTATKPIDKVTLTINNGDTNSTIDYVVLELSEVYISSYSSSSGGDKPGASISFSTITVQKASAQLLVVPGPVISCLNSTPRIGCATVEAPPQASLRATHNILISNIRETIGR